MSDKISSGEPSRAQPDPATLESIDRTLAVLVPEVRRLRRARWLAWGLAGTQVALLGVTAVGWLVYQDDRDDDEQQRAERRAAFEEALVAECMSSADQTADLRTAFNVLLGVAVDPNVPEEVALGRQLNDRLDEAVPPRDCAQEARDRSTGG